MPEIIMGLTGIKRAIRTQSPKIVKKSIPLAMNKTIRSTRTVASTKIRKTYTIKKKDLDKKIMRIIRANTANQRAIISVIGRPISLAKFRARQLKKGVKVSALKGKRTMLTGHFLTTVKTNKTDITHTGVFKRLGKSRLPIGEPRMISVPSMFAGERVVPAIKRNVRERWPIEFRRALRFQTAKARR